MSLKLSKDVGTQKGLFQNDCLQNIERRRLKKNYKIRTGWIYEWRRHSQISNNVNVHEVVRGPFTSPRLLKISPFVTYSLCHKSNAAEYKESLRRGIPDTWAESLALKGFCNKKDDRILRKNLLPCCVRLQVAKDVWSKLGLPLAQGIPDPWKDSFLSRKSVGIILKQHKQSKRRNKMKMKRNNQYMNDGNECKISCLMQEQSRKDNNRRKFEKKFTSPPPIVPCSNAVKEHLEYSHSGEYRIRNGINVNRAVSQTEKKLPDTKNSTNTDTYRSTKSVKLKERPAVEKSVQNKTYNLSSGCRGISQPPVCEINELKNLDLSQSVLCEYCANIFRQNDRNERIIKLMNCFKTNVDEDESTKPDFQLICSQCKCPYLKIILSNYVDNYVNPELLDVQEKNSPTRSTRDYHVQQKKQNRNDHKRSYLKDRIFECSTLQDKVKEVNHNFNGRYCTCPENGRHILAQPFKPILHANNDINRRMKETINDEDTVRSPDYHGHSHISRTHVRNMIPEEERNSSHNYKEGNANDRSKSEGSLKCSSLMDNGEGADVSYISKLNINNTSCKTSTTRMYRLNKSTALTDQGNKNRREKEDSNLVRDVLSAQKALSVIRNEESFLRRSKRHSPDQSNKSQMLLFVDSASPSCTSLSEKEEQQNLSCGKFALSRDDYLKNLSLSLESLEAFSEDKRHLSEYATKQPDYHKSLETRAKSVINYGTLGELQVKGSTSMRSACSPGTKKEEGRAIPDRSKEIVNLFHSHLKVTDHKSLIGNLRNDNKSLTDNGNISKTNSYDNNQDRVQTLSRVNTHEDLIRESVQNYQNKSSDKVMPIRAKYSSVCNTNNSDWNIDGLLGHHDLHIIRNSASNELKPMQFSASKNLLADNKKRDISKNSDSNLEIIKVPRNAGFSLVQSYSDKHTTESVDRDIEFLDESTNNFKSLAIKMTTPSDGYIKYRNERYGSKIKSENSPERIHVKSNKSGSKSSSDESLINMALQSLEL